MKKRYKQVKGVMGSDWLKKYGDSPNRANLLLEAMANPDLLSEESGMFGERDYDADIDRETFAKKVYKAYDKLTPKQKTIIEALQTWPTQDEAAKQLGISRSTIANTLLQIQKKILKLIDNDQNEGQ